MLIVLHVSIALASIVQATCALLMPAEWRLKATRWLVGATHATGTLLVWQMHSPLLRSCMTGLAYLAVVLGLMAVAQYRLRLAKVPVRSR